MTAIFVVIYWKHLCYTWCLKCIYFLFFKLIEQIIGPITGKILMYIHFIARIYIYIYTMYMVTIFSV
jgi:hypothetical protein